jgi:dUTP pyrophosphatase
MELNYLQVTKEFIKQKENSMSNIKINCILEDYLLLPEYASSGASGMDLRASKFSYASNPSVSNDIPKGGYTLDPHQRVLIKTGVKIALPSNYEAQIRPRSGLALKNGVTVLNTPGTIDDDYRGEIGVILFNTSNEPFKINKGDRIAQMVFMKVEKFDLEIVDDLDKTGRGEGGYNSTGVK